MSHALRDVVNRSLALGAVLIAAGGASQAEAQQEHRHDAREAAAVDAAMGGQRLHDVHRLHLELTPARAPSRADSVRAAELAVTARRAVEKYRDVRVAEADGFRVFAPGGEQKVYHYTHWQNAVAEHFRFDPAKPTSLLYERGKDGGMVLVGVMYATGHRASLDELDVRVPLSIARWHRHVNLCVPRRSDRERWFETRDGLPLFGPMSPIATREACEQVGGRFLPNLFGWMVHANVFASDPADVWQQEHDSP